MPPKISFARKDVLRAAFQIACEEGLKELTARKAASRLDSSTAPVYSNFDSMQELKKEVMDKARDLLGLYISKPYTDKAFLNMAIGVIVFAREQGMLFRAMFLEGEENRGQAGEFLNSMKEELEKDPGLSLLPDQNRAALTERIWIFTLGLAAVVSSGLIEDYSDRYIIETLSGFFSLAAGAGGEQP